jgi:site-specific DNA recombinase
MEAAQLSSAQQLRYCLYARKSSESDERQAMSIDSQIKEMSDLAKREGLHIVKVLRESHSAKDSGKREIFNELLAGFDSGEYNAALVWDPSRLSRNAGDLGALVDRMDRSKLIQIRTFSQTFTNNPNEKFLLMILCSQAKLENDNRGINVKRGIRAKCEMGWRPGNAPLGYMNRAFNGLHDMILDPDRSGTITQIFEHAAQGWSGRKIKNWLDEVGFTNKSGKLVTISQVFIILNNTFYYGEFEYPEGSGKWYKGAHTALVTKELYEQVQQSRALPNKAGWGTKNFAFKGIFKCAGCGSEITAEEKFKALKDGSFNRHVYYHCTRQINYDCPEKYINEQDLINQLTNYIAEHHDAIKVTDEIARKAVRHAEIVEEALQKRGAEATDIDPLTEYSEFVLNHGTYSEQARLIEGIKTTFAIKDKQITTLTK